MDIRRENAARVFFELLCQRAVAVFCPRVLGAGNAISVSSGRTLAPSDGLTGLPTFTPPGHAEHATPVGAPIITPSEP
jgi:hypothetical protein